MLRAVSLCFVLFGLWLLLSGHFEPLLLALGAVSAIVVALIAYRMDVADHEGHPIHLSWKMPLYWIWLAWQIILANFHVARRIIHPRLPIHPTVFKVSTSQHSELGQVIYANSITLTPGTVTISVDKDIMTVHALTRGAAEDLESGEMDRRVTNVEAHPEIQEQRPEGTTGGTES